MVQISEVKGNNRDNRTAAHTHIRGLGLNVHGFAEKQAGGFVGQTTAREVCIYISLHFITFHYISLHLLLREIPARATLTFASQSRHVASLST